MALFKPMVGASKAALDEKSLVAGYVWFTTNDGKFYIDWEDKNKTLHRSVLNAGHADTAGHADSADTASTAVSANSAGSAIKAEQDSGGNVITSTYLTKTNAANTYATISAVNGKAPTNHASSANTYGVGNTSNYGHIKIGSNISVTDGVISLSKANVVAALGYTPPTTDTNTTYTFATGDNNGQIKVTPSGGSAQHISVKGLGSAAYKDASGSWDISITGNAATATALSATLAVNKGGTGLTAAPSLLVNLGSTSAANIFVASPRPGITGTLAVGNGGTGVTGAKGSAKIPVYLASNGITACTDDFAHFTVLNDFVEFTDQQKQYLPLTGGTLTGALHGTTAEFDTVTAGQVFGAVWNDYAEYRMVKTEENIPGKVVYEIGRDMMEITKERLLPGCKVISDTYGFAIGETSLANSPIAVSGRVLAYPHESIDLFKIGDAVCSGPNGTISKMTRDEIITYPDRILGIVSSIPDYEYWGPKKIPVNGRIWIYVR